MARKQNCWEIEGCGREPGGRHALDKGLCPAATDVSSDGLNDGKNGGRICWAIAGTFCGGVAQGTFAAKVISCMVCEVFKRVREEAGLRPFTLLKPGQLYLSAREG